MSTRLGLPGDSSQNFLIVISFTSAAHACSLGKGQLEFSSVDINRPPYKLLRLALRALSFSLVFPVLLLRCTLYFPFAQRRLERYA